MLNHDTPGIKSQVIFLTNCQILLSIRLNMLTKQKKNLTLDQGCCLMSVRFFHNEQANLQLYTTQPNLCVEERLAVTLFRYNKHLKISKVLIKMWSPPGSLPYKARTLS